MIVASYILKSVLIMGIFLLFHKIFLEKEKMHEFNRFYLLTALILSLIVPFLPTGFDLFSSTVQYTGQTANTASITFGVGEGINANSSIDYGKWVIMLLYLSGVLFATLRFGFNLTDIIKKAKKGKIIKHGNARIILLDEKVAPFTFLNHIFFEKRAFENNEIDQKLLDHELTHVQQRHSWDIILVELIAILYWFNPLLYGYKRAIQLNHEFLADASVLSRFKELRSYQGLLLDMIQPKNKILLASNFNFQLTQKRLKMMTKKSSYRRKTFLQFSVIPIALGVMLGFGSPVIAQKSNQKDKVAMQQDLQKVKDKYFANAQINYTTEDGQIMTVQYKKLDKKIKDQLPPPPPPPPAPPGTKMEKWDFEPLPAGTMVYLKEDGKVRVGEGTWSAFPPPPPPPPPAVSPRDPAGKHVVAPKPPKPPVAPKSAMSPKPPKPPVPPPSIEEMIDEVDEFYVDGEKSSKEEVLKIWRQGEDKIATIDVKKMDKKVVMYVNMK